MRKLRRREEKRKLRSIRTIMAVLALLLIPGGFLFRCSLSNAQNSNSSENASVYKYYTSIKIQEGDTLWDIADFYLDESSLEKREYVKEIERLNKIDGEHIQSGDHLLIPYYSEKYF